MDYFLARYYSSARGRFTSVDPENVGTDPEDPQSWNGYAYAGNNPIVHLDPDGFSWADSSKAFRAFKVLLPSGETNTISDAEARATFLNPEWLQGMGYTSNKGVNRAGWLTGRVYGSDGELVFSFTRISFDDFTPFANAVFDQADKITHDPVVWATIGAFKVYGRVVKGPSGLKSTEKYLEKRWDKGTFGSKKKSIDYHVQKHGKGLSPVEYTKRAEKNFNNPDAVRVTTSDKQGRTAVQVTSNDGTGLYTPSGKIIWFHPK